LSSQSAASGGSVWDPVLIDKITRALAAYIGPMAKVIVNRAARKATTLEELYNLVAAEIPAASDQREFLASCHH
jgi:serine/threonine-protein kinase